MEKSTVEDNVNFRRAKLLLDEKIHDPDYLITLWKLMPVCHSKNPSIEKVKPWYKGLEDLI